MTPKREVVPRPRRSTEYALIFATRQAEKCWLDLVATQRNAVVAAWDFLTRTPLDRLPGNHRLRGSLSVVTHEGQEHEQWQHELSNGARIWFYVTGQDVLIVQVHTHHPNQTK